MNVNIMKAVELNGVHFRYRGAERDALSGVDFAAAEGERVGVIGLTGAGKSSLLRCMNRLIPASYRGDFAGRVALFGEEISGKKPAELAGTVGMVFQDFESQLFSTAAELDVAFGPENLGLPREEIRARVEQALHAVGMSELRKRDPSTLSGGQKQRLAIACALALQPRLLCLDEPTTDLDPEGREEISKLLARFSEKGLTVILAEHEPELLTKADRLVALEAGRKVRDAAAAELLGEEKELARLGVRPPDLTRVMAGLQIPERPSDLENAEAVLRRRQLTPVAGAAESLLEKDAAGRKKEGGELYRIQELFHRYPNGVAALSGVNLEIRRGEFLAVLGRNGSGKTTLVKHLNGLLRPSQGAVILEGQDTRELRVSELGRRTGFVFQDPDHQIFAARVFDEVAFAPRNHGVAETEIKNRVCRVLELVGLSFAEEQDPFLMTKGERQRVALASVLSAEPTTLILDEPTTGLDYPAQRAVMDLLLALNREGATVIVVTHTLWVAAEYARRCVLMNEGKILADAQTRTALADPELIARAGLKPPEIMALGRRFGLPALSVSEFLEAVKP